MDKYVMAVLLLMPGFLAINTAEKLGKTHTKKQVCHWHSSMLPIPS